jgi:hypothetical protein
MSAPASTATRTKGEHAEKELREGEGASGGTDGRNGARQRIGEEKGRGKRKSGGGKNDRH